METTVFKDIKKMKQKLEKAAKETKDMNEKLKLLTEEAIDRMIEEQIKNITVDGTMFTLSALDRPSILKDEGGDRTDRFFRYLRRNGFGDLIVIRKEVNTQTLGKWYREYVEEEPVKAKILGRYLKVFNQKSILVKGLNKTAGGKNGESKK